MYYVYLLKSEKNNRIYIGSTNNLKKRIKEHNKGKVFSTKYYLPWRLIYYEAYDKESLARLREKRLKYNGNALRELKKRLNFLPLKSGAGFTLTEILVVIFIISLLSALTFANYRQGGKEMALQRAAYKLAQDIRRAQEMAMAATECPSGTPCEGQTPPRYGLYISDPSGGGWKYGYYLFADLNGNGLYDRGSDPLVEPTQNTQYEGGVIYNGHREVTDCNPPTGLGGKKRIHLTFEPPDPKTVIYVSTGTPSNNSNCSEVKIFLEIDGQEKSVKINKYGMIEVQ
jgi:putative endonuclease